MKYLVCQFKDEPDNLFITTRRSRETMIGALLDLGQEIESVVLKEFDTYDEAMKYKKDINDVNQKLNQL